MKKLAYFAAGFLCALAVMVATPIVGAQPREVSVLYGVVSLVVDGVSFGSNTLLFNDRTYVPLRSISEAFGADVDYDPATRTAIITTVESSETHFEHFQSIPTFEFVTGVRDINIFEHNAERLWFSVGRNYASEYEFLQYIEALTVAGFTDEFGQDIGGNGTIVLTGHGIQIIVSMLGPSYTFSIVRI